jgi:hypothetical protein
MAMSKKEPANSAEALDEAVHRDGNVAECGVVAEPVFNARSP